MTVTTTLHHLWDVDASNDTKRYCDIKAVLSGNPTGNAEVRKGLRAIVNKVLNGIPWLAERIMDHTGEGTIAKAVHSMPLGMLWPLALVIDGGDSYRAICDTHRVRVLCAGKVGLSESPSEVHKHIYSSIFSSHKEPSMFMPEMLNTGHKLAVAATMASDRRISAVDPHEPVAAARIISHVAGDQLPPNVLEEAKALLDFAGGSMSGEDQLVYADNIKAWGDMTTNEFFGCLDEWLHNMSDKSDEPSPTSTSPTLFELPASPMQNVINTALGGVTIEQIHTQMASLIEEVSKPRSAGVSISIGESTTLADPSDEIPDGDLVIKNVGDLFDIPPKARKSFAFDVPFLDWATPHPHVPAIDPDYQFDPILLSRVLYSLVSNTRCWLHGHTGTGKSTLVEQVCARLQYPLRRVNFDSEITRMDLIGRDVLTRDGDATVSKFEEGILPQAMQTPCVLLCDEIDFVRPDVSYVAQRVLEAEGKLMLMEDGGRVVNAHPMFRIMATANTKGQGDEHGMYSGARVQSMAFLERFTSWAQVEYMSRDSRRKLLKAKVTDLSDKALGWIDQYVEEHCQAFVGSQVMLPISPRGFLSLANSFMFFQATLEPEHAIREAFNMTILDRATEQDKVVLDGIAQRVFGV